MRGPVVTFANLSLRIAAADSPLPVVAAPVNPVCLLAVISYVAAPTDDPLVLSVTLVISRLQIVLLARAGSMTGAGLTVIVNVLLFAPALVQPFSVAFTTTVPTKSTAVVFDAALKAAMLPAPAGPKPIAGFVLVQLK